MKIEELKDQEQSSITTKSEYAQLLTEWNAKPTKIKDEFAKYFGQTPTAINCSFVALTQSELIISFHVSDSDPTLKETIIPFTKAPLLDYTALSKAISSLQKEANIVLSMEVDTTYVKVAPTISISYYKPPTAVSTFLPIAFWLWCFLGWAVDDSYLSPQFLYWRNVLFGGSEFFQSLGLAMVTLHGIMALFCGVLLLWTGIPAYPSMLHVLTVIVFGAFGMRECVKACTKKGNLTSSYSFS